MKKSVNISAVVITYNEEDNIERCLDSVAGVADEVVVVDSFSSDRTEAISKARGVNFIQHRFEGHIEQKNYAVSCARNERILSLDADEALSDTLKHSIMSARQEWEFDGYSVNRLTNYCGKWIRHCGW
jgi:glycosyltransferase involved in cell wall biosynthesis